MTRAEAKVIAVAVEFLTEQGHEAMAWTLKRLLPQKRKPLAFRPVAPGKDRAERRKTKAEARRSTRPLVEARADGRCEAATYVTGPCSGSLHWDHFWGRGKVPPAVEAEWMLCERHDRLKTLNEPTRENWIRVFQQHCIGHGYVEEAAKCQWQIELEQAQHPARLEEPSNGR